jgi:hypothetical protein
MKKIGLLMVVMALVVGTAALSFADSSFGPAAIYANLTGTTEADAYALRLSSDLTFGELAEQEGIFDEFHDAILDAKIEILNEMVASGDLTQEEADELIDIFETCDGTQQHLGLGMGYFGNGGNGGQYGVNGGQFGSRGTGYCGGLNAGTANAYGTGNAYGNGNGNGFGR